MARRRTSLALVLTALAVVVTLAGCGADTETPTTTTGPTPDQQVRTVVAQFAIATQKKAYGQICDDLLSKALVDKIEAVGLPCERALEEGFAGVKAPTLQITDVSISQGKALASVHTTATGQKPSDDAIQLVQESGAWKIASLADGSGSGGASTTAPPSTNSQDDD